MNSLLATLDIQSWKPVLAALVLPPIPFLLLIVLAADAIGRRRTWGWVALMWGIAGLWLGSSSAVGDWLQDQLLDTPPALSEEAITGLRNAPRDEKRNTAIVILGGGMEPLAPEYQSDNLSSASLERLRYGLWLSRQTGLSVAFTGGVGWAQAANGPAEADVAARIAALEFALPLRWTENRSRDTRQNAELSVALLKKDGIRHLILVTHGDHMPRALKMFNEAAQGTMTVQPAPMGLATGLATRLVAWLPSPRGFDKVHRSLHEWLGLKVGS